MNTLWLQRGGDTRGGRLRIAPFGALGHGVQTRLVGEAPGKEGLASGCLKGWGGGVGRGEQVGEGPLGCFQRQRGACGWGVAAEASPVMVESMGQTRINFQDQLTAG